MCLKLLHLYSLLFYFFINGCLEKLCVAEATSEGAIESAARIKVFTVATKPTDGYLRYMQSARDHGITDITVLGMGEEWKGGNMARSPAGGHKINFLRDAVEKLQHEKDTIILFTDGYDVIFLAGLDEIYKKFIASGARVLFSAEKFIWPRESLGILYPPIRNSNTSRYLNSGGFIGYAPEVSGILHAKTITNREDDQLYFTEIFLSENLRQKYGIKLDTDSNVFHNLQSPTPEPYVQVRMDLTAPHGRLVNLCANTEPSIVHANGNSKPLLNAFDAFLLDRDGVAKARNVQVPLDENNLPSVLVIIVIKKAVPFFDLFLEKIEKLDYPKYKLDVFIHCDQPFHDAMIDAFIKRHRGEYQRIEAILSEHASDELAQVTAFVKAEKNDYTFMVAADAHIDDPSLLRHLLMAKKRFIAPLFEAPDNHKRARGYLEATNWPEITQILDRKFIGVWNCPYAESVYLIKKSILAYTNYLDSFGSSMSIVLNTDDIFMYLDNRRIYGHLVDVDDFDITNVRPDFHMWHNNERDWIDKYMHPDYRKLFDSDDNITEVCPDVYHMPFVTKAFCDDMIHIMSTRGSFIKGVNKKDGFYDPVPTTDIHTTDVGLHAFWIRFLNRFVNPIQEKLFRGYASLPVRCDKAFMVRYNPEEQSYLRPHIDHSIYTINIAMNQEGVDYEGGGCRFIRYNCSVVKTKTGWAILHPSQLMHMHEGLPVTNGTRLIFVSFNDDAESLDKKLEKLQKGIREPKKH